MTDRPVPGPSSPAPVDRLALGVVEPRGAEPSVCYEYNCFADE